MKVRDNSRRSRPTMSQETFIILTARNEAERIEATLKALAGAFPGASMWVADDGSTDDTPAIARRAGATVVRSGQTIGKGGAATLAARQVLGRLRADGIAREGVRQGPESPLRGRGGDLGEQTGVAGEDYLGEAASMRRRGDCGEPAVVLCDGDLGESARLLVALVDAIGQDHADLAVAIFSRRVGGGMGLAVRFARWAIRRQCGLDLAAPLSGQRALRATALEDVLPFAQGFGMEVGMTIDAARAGHRVMEVELNLEHRATGRTPSGFAHRGRQLLDCARAYMARR